jgi:uncharacterized protein (TIGR00369 family)
VAGPTDAIVRGAIVGAPYGALLGVRLEALEAGRVRVRLPFRPELTTVGDVVHGGAIASLIDVAATAAVWSGADPATATRGTTVGLALNFLSAGRGQDLVAAASVIQRGRTICVCEVGVEGADGTAVARALVTYKVG